MPTTRLLLSAALAALPCVATLAQSQGPVDPRTGLPTKQSRRDAFRQLDQELPTPTTYRTGSGAPGHEYWQQEADYLIDVTLDEATRRITGRERVTYHNHSPDRLEYLWLQLDLNLLRPDADGHVASSIESVDQLSYRQLGRTLARNAFDGGVEVTEVSDADGEALPFVINGTMMRIDLPKPLQSKASTAFHVAWNYQMNNADEVGARTAAEYFERDDNWIFELAHWFPRMAAYTDLNGWENKQFLGRGEFTLEFGDYEVRITVPADHIVAATGVLQNSDEVLAPVHRERLEQAAKSDRPVLIITPDEALANEKEKASNTKTWIFKGENVRDFAWASSRKFLWDAIKHTSHGRDVWCMSYWPNEGEPLWSRYSTQAVMHTLDVYSQYSFPYPYPVAISVNGPVGGMEYPMICFNGPRPEPDGTYSKRTKYGLISVIIHEVGHNYFPMIVNSDERQWTWMDEGLNTFMQFLAEQEWEGRYPSRRGEPHKIVDYMTSTEQVPIMTHSDSVLSLGPNAYAKPATALNILRETVMGRELFDHAFRTYSQRWMFKRPYPADLFRTMEDASAVDLDWFWRGWFYTTDHCDIALTNVQWFKQQPASPDDIAALAKAERDSRPTTVSERRFAAAKKRTAAFPELVDFYNRFDELDVTPRDRAAFSRAMAGLDEGQKKLRAFDHNLFVLSFENKGGLVMPIILDVEYADGSHEEVRIPAEIWRRNEERVNKLLIREKEIVRVVLDPHLETADVNLDNNEWPPRLRPSRFELFQSRRARRNPMQEARREGSRRSNGSPTNGGQGGDK
ncbi:MAG: M1 family metallopeptidase [bacterium]|nr:M1 family metallopeptidase [bacterium]